jgi:hypothetical protein
VKPFTQVLVGLLVATAIAACSENHACAGLPAARVLPHDSTIAVGQALTVRLESGGYCAGQSPTAATYQPVAAHWTTLDTVIVSLDSLTGVVTGRRSGDAHVTPTVQLGGIVTVHVR